MEDSNVPRVPVQIAQGFVIASIQIDLTADVLGQFRLDLLEGVQRSAARGVILDVSGLQVLDLEDFIALRKTMEMAAVMGARCVLSGLQPGVISALIDLDADVDGIEATLNLDDALRLLSQSGQGSEKVKELPSDEPEDGSNPDQG
jgi:rsbT antagonist protein RsbS